MTELRPMTQAAFEAFLARSVPDYASDKVRAGTWRAEDALQLSQKSHAQLLPQGLATPDNHLFTIVHGGVDAGNLWLAVQGAGDRALGFVYDLFVAEAFRRRGVATAAMRLLEGEAAHLGLESISLHVFGFNDAARELYAKIGYVVTDIDMSKSLRA